MLYIVGTPLGNAFDLSFRQAQTLAQSDVILAEDTRSASTLFKKIFELFPFANNPKQQIISYYRESEFEKLPRVIELLKEDKKVALISESGMPLINDPGFLLIQTVIKEKLPFKVIPGPSAPITALVYSGFNPKQFVFLGYFPKKSSEIEKLLEKIDTMLQSFPDLLIVFFESPQRINATLELINARFPTSTLSIGRELTKKFEEIIRGKPKDLKEKTYKGELTVVLKIG